MTTPQQLRIQIAAFGEAHVQDLLYASVQQLVSEIYDSGYIARHNGLRRCEPVRLGGAHGHVIAIVERMFHDLDGTERWQGLIRLPAIPILALSFAISSITESRWTGLTLTKVDALHPAPLRGITAGPSILPLYETEIRAHSDPFTPSHRAAHVASSLRWPTEAVRLNMEYSGLLGVAPPPFELKVTVGHGHGQTVVYQVTMQQVEDPRVAMRTWPPLSVVHWHFTAQALNVQRPTLSFVIEFS